jgi:hypothetical protein
MAVFDELKVNPNRPSLDEQVTSAPAPDTAPPARDIVFISKATPGDDAFALWLAPKLEAAGYRVFADILSLRAGESWRKRLTETLRDQAVKMLLVCKDSTLQKTGVQEEIGIANHVMKKTGDDRFIFPLRLESYAPTFGVANTQFVDFASSWAQGLDRLLDELAKAKVPKANTERAISPDWEVLRRHLAVSVRQETEALTSNWLRIAEWPDVIRFVEVSGALDHPAFARAVAAADYPMVIHQRGILTFLTVDEINENFAQFGRFVEKTTCNTSEFSKLGMPKVGLAPREASNHLTSMLSKAWERHARNAGLIRYEFSSRKPGFHIGEDQAKLGQKISWGKQGNRRSSMLRNKARGKVWSFGVTAIPALWPFPHMRLKARVLFSDLVADQSGPVIDSPDQQHRLRRTVCKGWRNKQWHGRLMAYLEILSGDMAWISIPLSPSAHVRCEAQPLLFTSPVTTQLPDVLSDDDEETDPDLLGGFADEDDEEHG